MSVGKGGREEVLMSGNGKPQWLQLQGVQVECGVWECGAGVEGVMMIIVRRM